MASTWADILRSVAEPAGPSAGTRAARGTLWLSLGAWTAKGTQTALLLVLAHFLVPSELGILAIAALAFNILSALNNLGVADAITYRKDRVEDAARTALTLMIGLGATLTVATWFAAPALASFFHSPHATFVLRGFAISLVFDAAATVPVALLTRSLDFRRRVLPDALPMVISAVVTISVVAAGHGLGGLVAGQVTAGVTQLLVALAVSKRLLPGWDRELAREVVRYGKHLGAAAVGQLALLNVDYIVVGHVLGPTQLGYYSLAFRICYMPFLAVSFVVNGVAFPYYCRMGSMQKVAGAVDRVSALVNTASVPLYAGLLLFAGQVTLLGHKWAPAVGAIRLLAVYGLILSVINTGQAALKAAGTPGRVLSTRLLHLGLLTVVLVATTSYGITVVALDQALVAAIVLIVTLWWTVRYVGVDAEALLRGLVLPVACGGAMAAVYFAGRLIPVLSRAPSWTATIVLGLATAVAYAVVTFVLTPDVVREGWRLMRARASSSQLTDEAHELAGSAAV